MLDHVAATVRSLASFRRVLPAALLGAVVLAPVARADVLEVGPGKPFAEIQDAVNAASDGDVILVAPGDYITVRIVNKTLAIVGDGGVPRIRDAVRVLDLAAGKRVVLQNLRNQSFGPTGGYESGLEVIDCVGQVVAESCEWNGVDSYDRAGVAAFNSQAVTLANSSCTGRAGTYPPYGPGEGGAGVLVVGSRVSIENCVLTAGRGAFGDSEIVDGGDGGHGLKLLGAEARVHVAATTLVGGDGGSPDCTAFDCGEEGPGGHAVRAEAGTSLTTLRDNSLTSGDGIAPTAKISTASNNTVLALASRAVTLDTNSPVRAGADIDVAIQGSVGDLALLLVSGTPGWTPVLGKEGVFQLGLPLAFANPVMLGPIPPGGALDRSITAPSLPAGFEAVELFAQVATVSSTLEQRLGGSTFVLLLDGI